MKKYTHKLLTKDYTINYNEFQKLTIFKSHQKYFT